MNNTKTLEPFTWNSFNEGDVIEFGDRLITKEEIIDFASVYDPQPFHLDEEAAKDSLLGTFCASGWHNCTFVTGMLHEEGLIDTAALGFPQIKEMRWMKPVCPGYRLRIKQTCISKAASEADPTIGRMEFRYDIYNQYHDQLMRMDRILMFPIENGGA